MPEDVEKIHSYERSEEKGEKKTRRKDEDDIVIRKGYMSSHASEIRTSLTR